MPVVTRSQSKMLNNKIVEPSLSANSFIKNINEFVSKTKEISENIHIYNKKRVQELKEKGLLYFFDLNDDDFDSYYKICKEHSKVLNKFELEKFTNYLSMFKYINTHIVSVIRTNAHMLIKYKNLFKNVYNYSKQVEYILESRAKTDFIEKNLVDELTKELNMFRAHFLAIAPFQTLIQKIDKLWEKR